MLNDLLSVMINVDCLLFKLWSHLGDKHSDIPERECLNQVSRWVCLWVFILIRKKMKVRRSTREEGIDPSEAPVLGFRKWRKLLEHKYSLLSPSWVKIRCGKWLGFFLFDTSIMENCTLPELWSKGNLSFLEFLSSGYFLTATGAITDTL